MLLQAQSIGFTVVLAQRGDEAVEMFARHHASLAAVLLDLQMPGAMDGWDAAIEMRRLEARRGPKDGGVAIVACTACAQHERVPELSGGGGGAGLTVRQHTLACGADEVVRKPIQTAALRGVVEAVMQRRRAAAAGGGSAGECDGDEEEEGEEGEVVEGGMSSSDDASEDGGAYGACGGGTAASCTTTEDGQLMGVGGAPWKVEAAAA
ncbi:hypothetical protein MNEG_10372 [Monoraphidium neglectum]|uniref:Response regulatory domain-containing protein n=1 Tax=Monoraphidium neglectum TaxID=145388 RepID=A0A0D2M9B2_9CHLO|nr:hypothetical protein MNEG_10372 [Monoraphidium neglectum]KIY97591.1 hypothetical protein MNEG_10372 [Monoraphidium neglectum]|eukprot:XP_013896611.1 hypothetical protein MNEG_10372 [Monoraphidium neglectum]